MDSSRIGSSTEVAQGTDEINYADLRVGKTTLEYHSDKYPDKPTYRVVTRLRDTEGNFAYGNAEGISKEAAMEILDQYNGGVWGYVE